MSREKRRKPISFGTDLERLEGRQLLSAVPSQVRIREVADSKGIELWIQGTKKADQINIDDNGTASAGNITVTYGDKTYTSTNAITTIYVVGNKGNDTVAYNLTGNLIAARTVLGYLGAGNDQFTANLSHDIQTSQTLDLEATGDSGADTLTVNQMGVVTAGTLFPYLSGGAGNDTITYKGTGDIGPLATIGPALIGGGGNDTITLDYTGNVAGQFLYNTSLDGGAGADVLTAAINLGVNSVGKIGQSSAVPGTVRGGKGNDKVQFTVQVNPAATTAQVFAVAMGDAGKDTVLRSSRVSGDTSNETDAVIS